MWTDTNFLRLALTWKVATRVFNFPIGLDVDGRWNLVLLVDLPLLVDEFC
jgi:hypothetical protein